MKFNFNKLIAIFLSAGIIVTSASCNKDVEDAIPVVTASPSGQSINDIINTDVSLTFLKAAVARAGTNISSLIADRTGSFTMFAPTDAAFMASGIASIAVINAMPAAQVESLLRYHIVGGQKITAAMIPTTFPNLQLPTQLVLSAPSASLPPGLRMSVFPSKRGSSFWANNIPLIQTDIDAANGVIHKTALLLSPPTAFLWNRIDTDPTLTYLRAAIIRADSGVVAASTLQTALLNAAANLTVFAPNDVAFKAILTEQIRLALIAMGVPAPTALTQATALASSPTVFANPLVANVLTPTLVKGIVVYHLFGSRAFSVNLPSTSTPGFKTLLNSAVAAHPGVTLAATFGPTGVTAASIKGLVNPIASNILINPTPGTGTSDQHYINGTLHVIDQVLLPQ